LINFLLAFVTGLTTGGLSCLAVQGGLLASSLANQIEKDLQIPSPKAGQKTKAANPRHEAARRQAGGQQRSIEKAIAAQQAQKRAALAQPILAFLAAKLLAYTLLGFLLGMLGQMFQLDPIARAFLQIAIGIFMLGSALRMLNVHPIFRYFAFEPPAFLRRKLRRTAAGASGESLATPILLGFLTVLIPCGVTQAMMAVALSSASPIEGAALMFAFTLGTSPVFFAVAYFATRLGARLEKHFMRFVAVVMLVLAVVSIDSGLTLAGSPVSLTRFFSSRAFQPRGVVAAPADPAAPTDRSLPSQPGQLQEFRVVPDATATVVGPVAGDAEDVITINVENYGYNPDIVKAKAGVPIKLRLITNNTRSCSRAFVIPALRKQLVLPATGEEVIEIPAQQSGTQMPFSCSMGMFGGTIVFE
jgi:sulfite exporter TauE/SafE